MRQRVRTLIRLVAFALFIFGGLEVGLEYMRRRFHNTPINMTHFVIGVILAVCGAILFAASNKLAAKWTEDFDE